MSDLRDAVLTFLADLTLADNIGDVWNYSDTLIDALGVQDDLRRAEDDADGCDDPEFGGFRLMLHRLGAQYKHAGPVEDPRR